MRLADPQLQREVASSLLLCIFVSECFTVNTKAMRICLLPPMRRLSRGSQGWCHDLWLRSRFQAVCVLEKTKAQLWIFVDLDLYFIWIFVNVSWDILRLRYLEGLIMGPETLGSGVLRMPATKTQNVYGLVIHAWARTALSEFLCQNGHRLRSYEAIRNSLIKMPVWRDLAHLRAHSGHIHRSNSYLFPLKIVVDWFAPAV